MRLTISSLFIAVALTACGGSSPPAGNHGGNPGLAPTQFGDSQLGDANEIIIDIPAIAGKTKSEVAALIGAPSSCAASKYGEKCQYAKAETEIVFINQKADWITVEGLDIQPFSDSTIEVLGFKQQKPTSSNAISKAWEPLQGLKSLSLFKGSNNSDYAYIKVTTK